MDPTRPVTYRGFEINDVTNENGGLVGSMLQRVSFGGVPGIGYNEKRALADGRSASDVFLDARPIQIEAVLHALSRGDLFDRLRDMIAAFTPTLAYAESPGDKGYMPLYFYLPTLDPAFLDPDTGQPAWEIECFLRARPMASPSYVIDRDRIGGPDVKPGALPYSVTLQAKDPRLYIMPRVDTTTTSSGGATLENRGNYPAPLNWEFEVPANSGTCTLTLVGGGTNMTIVVPTDAAKARIVRVSSDDHVITSQLAGGVETVAFSMLTQAAKTSWPSIPANGSAHFNWTTDKALVGGNPSASRLWYYETLA